MHWNKMLWWMGALLLLAFLFLAKRSKGQEMAANFERLPDREPVLVCAHSWPGVRPEKILESCLSEAVPDADISFRVIMR